MTDKEMNNLDEKLIDMVKKAREVSCDEITNAEYWNDEWTECPICHCKPDNDGTWTHKEFVIN